MGAYAEGAGAVDGHPITRIVLENGSGLRAGFLSFGATLQFLTVPGAQEPVHLALGFDSAEEYARKSGHLGATAGRFANRIANGRFELDGRVIELPRNEGRHHLHGGPGGFGKRPWQAAADPANSAAVFTQHSPDGDNGYPGALEASCTYRLRDDDVLLIEMTATTTAPTPLNLVNHTYWNLAGRGTVYDQLLEVEADEVLEVDRDTIPSGRKLPVGGTKLDFREARPVGPDGEPHLDNCYVLRGQGMRRVARLTDPASGRSLELHANQPGVQVYSGFKLDTTGRDGERYGPGAGLCLETEAFPNAPNIASFPSAILRPGETYRHLMELRFGLPR